MNDLSSIEKLAPVHLDGIMEIEALCYGQHHWSRESFVSEMGNKCAVYLVAVDSDKNVQGYMGMWKIVDEAHVTNLAVHPSYQRQGIAKRLILSALDICYSEKIKYITLEVRKSNIKALNLYESFGFKTLGIRKKYYQDNGEDAFIMWTENIFSQKYKEIYDKISSQFDNAEPRL